ncbi:MAG TPA: MFS transporter [Myxococcota bacterium]|nr:MFS transporter [Myxococcota bacterium]
MEASEAVTASDEAADASVAAAESDEAAFLREVRASLPRNYAAHLFHGLFGQTGFRLVTAPTFLPAYVHALSGGSAVWVGIARAAQSLGQCLSPLFSVTVIEHRRRVLPVALRVGSLVRLQVLGMGLAGFFLGTGQNLLAVCVFLALFGFFMGMQGVVFNFLLAKVIPLELRGRLSGLRNALAGLTSSAVGYLAGAYFVERNTFGNGYATTFLVSFLLTEIGLLAMMAIREPDSPGVRERARVTSRVRDLGPLLRTDPNFGVFLVAGILGGLGRIAMPYYVLYAGERLAIGGKELGLLTAAFLLASSVLNLFWGVVADRMGSRAVFLGSLAVWIAGTFALFETTRFAGLVGVFVAIGCGAGGFQMAQQILVLEFGSREDLPLRIGAANATTEATGVIAPLAGGLLATWWSFGAVFACAIAFKALAALVVQLRLADPRARRAAGG